MSTADSNIVNNKASGDVKALNIKYQITPEHKTYMRMTSATTYNNESLMAITIKGEDTRTTDLVQAKSLGNVKVDDILNIVLYDGADKIATIPFTTFFTAPNLQEEVHTDMAPNNYTTYYTKLSENYSFNRIELTFKDDSVYSGNVYIQDIYFPRFDSKVNYYYDDILDNEKTDTNTYKHKYGDTLSYTDKAITGYELDYTTPASDSLTIGTVASDNVLNVYYKKKIVPFNVEYYYDGVKDDSSTKSGTGTFEDTINISTYTSTIKDGYKLDSTADVNNDLVLNSTDSNTLKIYYVKDSFDYTINYYFDNVKDDSLTKTGKALFGTTLSYDKDTIRNGYELDKITPETKGIVISSNADSNVINVYYKSVSKTETPTSNVKPSSDNNNTSNNNTSKNSTNKNNTSNNNTSKNSTNKKNVSTMNTIKENTSSISPKTGDNLYSLINMMVLMGMFGFISAIFALRKIFKY